MADRSVSVPMTLSDLERRDASGIFQGISLITLVPVELEQPNSIGR